MLSNRILFIKMINTLYWWSWCFTTWRCRFSTLIKLLSLLTTLNVLVEFTFICLLLWSLSLFALLLFVISSIIIIIALIGFMVGFKVRSILHALADLIIAWGDATFTCGLRDLLINRLGFFIHSVRCLLALFLLLSVFVILCYYSSHHLFLNGLLFFLFIFIQCVFFSFMLMMLFRIIGVTLCRILFLFLLYHFLLLLFLSSLSSALADTLRIFLLKQIIH